MSSRAEITPALGRSQYRALKAPVVKQEVLVRCTRLENIMLRVANVDDARVGKLGMLTAHIVEQALASGLTLDEAIVAFGIAAKAMAARAANGGVGTVEQCTTLAERRLKSGMDHSAEVLRAFLG